LEWDDAVPKLADATRSARRGQIIGAALACFARTGYHATTMADVAAQAGVSKGTPYLYFPSKEALFIALHEEWDCALADRVDAAVQALAEPARRSPRRVLRTVAAAVGAHVVERPETCRVLMEARTLAAYYPAIATAVEASDARTHHRLQELFRAGVAAGEWPGDTDPALQARLFTAGLDGLMAQWHLAPHSFSWDAAATALSGDPADPVGLRGFDRRVPRDYFRGGPTAAES
jgi:TetR/AcrR family transcriptional repressor of uid operon